MEIPEKIEINMEKTEKAEKLENKFGNFGKNEKSGKPQWVKKQEWGVLHNRVEGYFIE